MAERKAPQKWYPPEWDPSMGSVNKVQNSHPLRHRARKLDQGILEIRFEMPYNIWCNGCGNHIGMGVRYNAEKRKVGNYHTTIIYQFRMRCHLCQNYFEIRTDPKNHDYEIVSGARRQEKRWDVEESGRVHGEDREKHFKINNDPMFQLQHKIDDEAKLTKVVPDLDDLLKMQRRYKRDYDANRAARNMFRSEKKERKAEEALDRMFLERKNINVKLLPESENDLKMAQLLKAVNRSKDEKAATESLMSIAKRGRSSSNGGGKAKIRRLSEHRSLGDLRAASQLQKQQSVSEAVIKASTTSTSSLIDYSDSSESS